jgi:prepilin-type processing-associated H-X9-DG protein
MDENLVGYLLQALDPETQRQVESYLRSHPEAQHRLELLRHALQPLGADADAGAPPSGLSVRTLAHIARHQCRNTASGPRIYRTLPSAPRPLPSQFASSRSWWRRADVLVAATLLVAMVGVGAPMLPRLWRDQQVYVCQRNLQLFHQALMAYSDHHHGEFPKVEAEPPRNIAGIFVPILNDSGLLAQDMTVNCPPDGRHATPNCSVKQLEELQQNQPDQFRLLTRNLAGCYAYSLGYRDGEDLVGLRRDSGDTLPIMADRPPTGMFGVGAGNSPNHGGKGQNVLYIDGHVRYATVRTAGFNGDDIYVNQQGKVAAGQGLFDSVLGVSWATPFSDDD